MTHRGDSDWHGWPLQPIVDQAAEALWARIPDVHPWSSLDANTQRSVKEAALPNVVDVLTILSKMDHPLVSELQGAFIELQAAYDRREHGGVAQDKCLRKIQHEILPRYTQEG